MCLRTEPGWCPRCPWQKGLLKQNTDLLVDPKVCFTGATRRLSVTIHQVVEIAWLLRYPHTLVLSQALSIQSPTPLLEHKPNVLPVLLDKQSGIEHPDPLADIPIPLAEQSNQFGVPLEVCNYRNSPCCNTKSVLVQRAVLADRDVHLVVGMIKGLLHYSVEATVGPFIPPLGKPSLLGHIP